MKTPELYDPRTLFRLQKMRRHQRYGLHSRAASVGCAFALRRRKIFEQVDVVITPTTPAPAPKTC